MKRIFITVAVVIVCFLLQSTLFEHISIAGITPNLLVVVTASVGFMRGKKPGMFIGFFAGLIMDVMYGNVVGLYALMYLLIGYVNGLFKDNFYPENIKLPVALIAISDLACNMVHYFVMFFFRQRFDFGYYFRHIMLPELVYTMIVAIFLYLLLLFIDTKLEQEERGETLH